MALPTDGMCYCLNANKTIRFMRMQVRGQYGIDGNCINDNFVGSCCQGCALGQMIAEIEARGAPAGGDSGVMDMVR